MRLCRITEVLLRPLLRQPWFIIAATVMGMLYPYIWNFMPSTPMRVVRALVYSPLSSFFAAYLLGWVVVACRGNRWVKGLILGAAWLLFLIDTAALLASKMWLSVTTAMMMMQTNGGEASEFMAQYLRGGTLWGLAIMALATLALAIVGVVGRTSFTLLSRTSSSEPQPPRRLARGWGVVLSLGVVAALAFGAFWWYKILPVCTMHRAKDLEMWESERLIYEYPGAGYQIIHGDIYTKAFYTLQSLRIEHEETAGWHDVNSRALHTPAVAPADSLDIVVIVGESFRRDASNLYGSTFDTNPRLCRERDQGRLTPFTDYITAANYTSGSMQNLFSLNDVSRGERWTHAPFWPAIFRSAGYSVALYDNQTVGLGSGLPDLHQGQVLWDPWIRDSIYDITNKKVQQYDGELLTPGNAPLPSGARRLAIYHLYGQHFISRDRVPPGSPSMRFTAHDIDTASQVWWRPEVRQEVADYLNATLYNDSVVAAILARHADRPTLAVYFSDHGIDLYADPNGNVRDNRPASAADLVPWLRRNFEIPFMVWTSQALMRRRPDIATAVRAAATRPGMLDNVGQMLLGVARIATPYYRAERDILSPSYNQPPRVTATGHAFDALTRPQGR